MSRTEEWRKTGVKRIFTRNNNICIAMSPPKEKDGARLHTYSMGHRSRQDMQMMKKVKTRRQIQLAQSEWGRDMLFRRTGSMSLDHSTQEYQMWHSQINSSIYPKTFMHWASRRFRHTRRRSYRASHSCRQCRGRHYQHSSSQSS